MTEKRRGIVYVALAIMLALALASCGVTREETSQSTTDRLNAITIQGTITMPNVGQVPIDLRIKHEGQDVSHEERSSRTSLTLPPFLSSPAGGGLLSLLPGGSTIAGILSLIAGAGGAEVVHRRKRRREMDVVKRQQRVLANASPEEANKMLDAMGDA